MQRSQPLLKHYKWYRVKGRDMPKIPGVNMERAYKGLYHGKHTGWGTKTCFSAKKSRRSWKPNVALPAAKLKEVVNSSSFSSMKKAANCNKSDLKEIRNPKEGDFLRKGVVGDWRNMFTPEQINQYRAVYDREGPRHLPRCFPRL
eukprot:g39731.t1